MNSLRTHDTAATDVLLELVNIGVGRAACGLSELTGREVVITVPTLEILEYGQRRAFDESQTTITLRVSQAFSGGINGHALIVLNRSGAVRLTQILLGKTAEDDAFDDNELGALLELGNIIMGNVVGVLASELDSPVNYQMPQLQLCGIASYQDLIADLTPSREARLLIMRASLTIEADKVSGYLMLLFQEADLNCLFEKLDRLAVA